MEISKMIKSDPELQTTVLNLKKVFQENGVFDNGKPNLIKMSMLLMNKDVRGSIESFSQKIKDANIDIQPNDLTLLFKLYRNSQ